MVSVGDIGGEDSACLMKSFFSSSVVWSHGFSRSLGHGPIWASCGMTSEPLLVTGNPLQRISDRESRDIRYTS